MPHPFFWVRRNADTYVPLIPIDELPESIVLKDISATKDWADVCRGEVRFLGDHYGPSGQYHLLEPMKPTVETAMPPAKTFQAPDVKDADQVQAKINNITSSQEHSPEGSQHDSDDDPKYAGNAGTLGKKVYCTYWIRTGNCNYMQEGCKYKHEIPPDDQTRLAIGVRTYPTWPREDPTPPPRPAKPEWQKTSEKILSGQCQKPALQQSWRRKTGHSQSEISWTQKCANKSNMSSAPASSCTKASGPFPPASHSGSSRPLSAHLMPLHHPAVPQTNQVTHNTLSTANQQGHNQAQNSSNPSAQHETEFSSAQTDSDSASSGSEGYGVGQAQQQHNIGPANPFAFGSKGSVNTAPSSAGNVNSIKLPPHMRTEPANSKGTQNHHPATLSYENHPTPIPGYAHGNTSSANNDNDPASSSSRVNTPATTNSITTPTLGQSSSFNHNAHGSNFKPPTFPSTNNHSHGKLSSGNGAPSLARGPSLALRAGNVFGKVDTRLQNPFSPPPFSPEPIHRRMFCEPGQAEYVANSTEEVQAKPQRPIKKNTNGSPPNKGKSKGLHAGKGFAHGHGQGPARSQAGGIMA